MLFKSFFEKFQPAPKPKNNWLMPFRKSGVKVNMKSVKFDRLGGLHRTINDIQTESRRPTTLPNLQKVDAFVADTQGVSSKQEDTKDRLKSEALFSKVHDTRKNPLNFGLVALIFLILAVSSVGIFLYSSNKSNEKKRIVEDCNKYVAEQKSKGFIPDRSCDLKLSWFENVTADAKATDQFDTIKKNLTKQASDQQAQIAQLDKDIRLSKQNLASIDANFEKELQGVTNLAPTTISDKQTLLTSLKALLLQKDKLISTSVNQFTYLLKISTDVDSQKEQALLKNYDSLAKTEKYSQYTKLVDSYNSYKQKLLEKSGEDWAKKSLESPDLYKFKVFAGDEFKNLIDNSKFENTTSPNNDLISIVGDDAADKRIIDIAEARGYKKRPVSLETSLVGSGQDRLQANTKNAFESMVAAAQEDGVRIGLVSGYRSINDQRSLFQTRFRNESLNINKGRVYTDPEIVSGKADEAINKVLSASSIPGYSRHHTGYTVDITDLNTKNDFTLFAETQGYKWISSNNYFNAKRFGFLPSYPPGASNQGPEPESWEYVYVGIEGLK
jgi:D-alanyl-D-alanine carboxypeptidase